MIPQELDDIRPERQRTLDLVADLTQRQLDFSPAAGKWSVGEVLDHIPRVETSLRGEIETLIELARQGQETVVRRSFRDLDISIAPIPKSMLPWLEIPFTLANLFTPRPVVEFLARSRWVPFRNPTAATPRHGRPAGDLRRDLLASCEATESLFTENPDVDYTDLVLRHPLMGANSVPDILRFLVSHEQRHQEQIRDVLRTPGMPGPEGSLQ